MEKREKKPPIRINEGIGGKEEESKSGPIGYVGTPDKPKKGQMNLTHILLSVALSALLAFLLLTAMAPSKGDVSTLNDNQGILQAGLTALTSRVDAFLNREGDYVKESDLTALTSLPATMEAGLATLQALISSAVSSLETRLDALEATTNTTNTTTPTPVPGEGVAAVKLASGILQFTWGANADFTSASVYLTISNTGTQDVKVTGMGLVVFPYQVGTTSSFLGFPEVVSSWPLLMAWSSADVGGGTYLVQGFPASPYVEVAVGAGKSVMVPVTFKFNLVEGSPEGSSSLGVMVNSFTYE